MVQVRFVFILVVLIPAMYHDWKEYRIQNKVIVLGWLLGIGSQYYRNGYDGILSWLVGVILPIIILWVLFRFKMLGAGDIKLFSVVGGFFGVIFVLKTMVIAFFIGAFFSLIRLIQCRNLKVRLQFLANYISVGVVQKKIEPYYIAERDGREPVIPFSVAIGLAVMLGMAGVYTRLFS